MVLLMKMIMTDYTAASVTITITTLTLYNDGHVIHNSLDNINVISPWLYSRQYVDDAHNNCDSYSGSNDDYVNKDNGNNNGDIYKHHDYYH